MSAIDKRYMYMFVCVFQRPTALAVPSDPDTLPYLQYIPQEERDPSNAFPSSTSLKSVAAKSEKPWNKSDLNLRSPSDHEDEAEDDAGHPGYWLKQRIIKKGMVSFSVPLGH